MTDILTKYNSTRELTLKLCEPLSVEDLNLQCNYDVSPTKWQLAHTTWYFEEFILKKFFKDYKYYNESYLKLFNSYYESMGERIDKSIRYIISRPSLDEILDYRKAIDQKINSLKNIDENPELQYLLKLGIEHEMQHQELILMDIKKNLFSNPNPTFYNPLEKVKSTKIDLDFINFDEGLYEFGADPIQNDEFCFDNEYPKHKHYLEKFSIANRFINNGEYLEFVKSDAYSNFNLWHSDGYEFIKNNKIKLPPYWVEKNGIIYEYTLHGLCELELEAPVTHISYYEAWAFAKWYGGRLATEFEYELALKQIKNKEKIQALTDPTKYLEPIIDSQTNFLGSIWAWTESAYLPYPAYKQAEGALGEYNGKFMINKMVLRGGSSYTPLAQCRPTYRNFFTPEKRWVLSGIRIAK